MEQFTPRGGECRNGVGLYSFEKKLDKFLKDQLNVHDHKEQINIKRDTGSYVDTDENEGLTLEDKYILSEDDL